MAMRSLVGKLKSFTGLMPRSGGSLPKNLCTIFHLTCSAVVSCSTSSYVPVSQYLQWSERPRKLIDPTKFDSVQEQARAIPARIDEQMKRDWDELQRRLKAYDRVTFTTACAGFGATLYGASCFVEALLEED